MLRWSDRTLLFNVRSDGVPTSGQAKTMETGWTGLWLRLVSCGWTRPVMTLGVLDLSGVDRTLGGSVRSLPPEHPVSGSCADLKLFSVFLSITGEPPYNRAVLT